MTTEQTPPLSTSSNLLGYLISLLTAGGVVVSTYFSPSITLAPTALGAMLAVAIFGLHFNLVSTGLSKFFSGLIAFLTIIAIILTAAVWLAAENDPYGRNITIAYAALLPAALLNLYRLRHEKTFD